INVCSDLTFYLSDKEHVVDWRTAKSKELFLYLLLNKDRMVHKSLLVDLLWEDLDLERALQLLYTTIYHIRRALKPFNNYLKIINKSETYMLTTSKTTIDLKEWESKLDSLTIIEDHTVEQIEQFMKLYTDPYLIKLDYEWAEAERFRL